MQLIIAWQRLRRHRIALAAAVLLSFVVAIVLTYHVKPGFPPQLQTKRYVIGVANERVLVDTPDSIVADLNPSGAASLSVHAQLLADLFSSEPIRVAIAREAKIPIQNLSVIPPAVAGAAPVQSPLATATVPPAAQATLTIGVDSTLPLVSIAAQAPNQTKANELADGAVSVLQRYLRTVATSQKIPLSRQPVIQALGGQSGTSTAGPSRALGVVAAIVLLGLSCYMILFVDGIRARLREGAEDAAVALSPIAATEHVPSSAEDDADDLRAVFALTPGASLATGRRDAPPDAMSEPPSDPEIDEDSSEALVPEGPVDTSTPNGFPAMVGSAEGPRFRQTPTVVDTAVRATATPVGRKRALNGLLGRR
jgi:hypothetical protein